MVRNKTGRPPEFKQRRTLTVLLEAVELRALHARAEADGVSASHFMRRLLQSALAGHAGADHSGIPGLRQLRADIQRRRKANHDERMRRRWNPEAIVTRFQTELLNFVEEELERLASQ